MKRMKRIRAGWSRVFACALTLPLLGACGGVRVGQSAEEAQAAPARAASQPPDQDPDAPSEATPLVTVDLSRSPAPDAGAQR